MDLTMIVLHGLRLSTLLGLGIQLFGLIGLFYFVFRRKPRLDRSKSLPGVSVVKPCYSNVDNEEENFDHLFRQDYEGPVQLLFIVSDLSDPIVPIVQNLLKRYPHRDAQLVISKTRNAYWRKIDALYDAHPYVKHEMVIWSDSDTMVQLDYLSEMVASLQEPGVSMVTTPQYDTGVNTFASALKVLGNNCDVASFVMALNLLVSRHKVGFGHSIGFKLSEFQPLESKIWRALNHSYADDQVLPQIYFDHGKKVVFRNVYCPVHYANKTFKQMLSQQERFAMAQRAGLGRGAFLLSFFLIPQISATIQVIAFPQESLSWVAFFGVFGLRVLISVLFESLVLKSVAMTLRYFWTIPLWDLFRIYLVLHACLQTEVQCQGRRFRFVGKFELEEIQTVSSISSVDSDPAPETTPA